MRGDLNRNFFACLCAALVGLVASACAAKKKSCESTTLGLSASSFSWQSVCQAGSVSLNSGAGESCTPESATTVFVHAGTGITYSDSACTSTTNEVVIPARSTSAGFYFKPASTSPALTASVGRSASVATNPGLVTPTAGLVLGQANFTSGTQLAGTGATAAVGLTAAGAWGPSSVEVYGGKLIVADRLNNRVLVWNTVPTVTGTAADLAIGQADLTSRVAATSSTGLSAPNVAKMIGSKLVVTDEGNYRVLIWNSLPTTFGEAASVVLGQPDFVTANQIVPSASDFSNPLGIAADSQGRFYMADWFLGRILVWNKLPTSSYAAADGVIGQADLASSGENAIGGGAVTATGMGETSGIFVYNDELWVADRYNHRVTKFTLP